MKHSHEAVDIFKHHILHGRPLTVTAKPPEEAFHCGHKRGSWYSCVNGCGNHDVMMHKLAIDTLPEAEGACHNVKSRNNGYAQKYNTIPHSSREARHHLGHGCFASTNIH